MKAPSSPSTTRLYMKQMEDTLKDSRKDSEENVCRERSTVSHVYLTSVIIIWQKSACHSTVGLPSTVDSFVILEKSWKNWWTCRAFLSHSSAKVITAFESDLFKYHQ